MKNHRIEGFIANPKKALFTLALPMMVGMMVQALYNVVDTAFVGRLGADAIAALTFSFPLFFILIALNSGIATGMSSRISRYLGAKSHKQAENTAMHGIFLSVIVAVMLFILGFLTMDRLFILFGASDTVLPLATSYFQIILFGIFFMFVSFMTNNIFIAQGDAKTPMIIQIFALLLNIVLDYVFIYLLGYGVQGAAIATFLSFFFAMFLAIFF